MLQSLSIQNFALIEEADIRFSEGFIAITGETGSGKSILLGALNLILGERADYSVIRNSEAKTIVEAVFQLDAAYKAWFEANELDYEPQTVIRREITSQGKSRAFVNDTPVGLTTLKELTEQLVYIHSQHQTLALKQPQFQFDVLDAAGNTSALAQETKNTVIALRKVQQELSALKEQSSAQQREIEFARFQWNELTEHRLDEIDYTALDKELRELSNTDQLKEVYAALHLGLTEDNGPLDRLRLLKTLLDRQKSVSTVADFYERLNASLIELQELSNDAQNALERLEIDPERIFELTQSVDRFNKLLSKYGMQTQEELLQEQQRLADQLAQDERKDERITELEQRENALKQQAQQLSDELYQKRVAASTTVSKRILENLTDLKMSDARIAFELERKTTLDLNGGMDIACLFSANPGMELKSIEKAASGGELSRVMLAIQAELSAKKGLPTLILDEIDTGVSGEVAHKVGQFLSRIGNHLQCVVVTHLPQVAAKSSEHLEVRKSGAQTSIHTLSNEEKLVAIAKMMSGEAVTEAALENAKALIG